ncbi:hypothetical protein PN36_16885 [Candidatus Thiomargarita nelsonii]|uniref:Transcriptional regulator AbiEi antitoxin N-terminal domain-containing protein n=1 Tax=Candidatus Thiomargarita nelsonii TaxID=1003181 RepID=A0A0A6P6Q9_9GAMM|nr:hypothetical protein PN36_16885 [Candidatus Thiomargarita nelsonii]
MRQNSSKINQLIKIWPQKTIAVQSWLSQMGFERQLVAAYEKTTWLNRIGRGAFVRADDQNIDWTGGLYAIQKLKAIHAGGKTALALHGYAHFLPLGSGAPVTLFGFPDVKLPAWFLQYDWGVSIRYFTTKLFSQNWALGLTTKDRTTYSITLSSPERAILELLYLIPQAESFEEAKLLMEGLTTLRPDLVQSLLKVCDSVKVKRLFMLLAERCDHAWLDQLDLSQLNFGKGKRVIGEGGHFNSKYQISVPDRQAT